MNSRYWFCVVWMLAANFFVWPAAAQDYPARPIRWVIPFPPGGPTDLVVRLVAPKLSERMGQPVIIENRPGAFGNLGTAFVAKAPPDGYTLLYIVPALVTNPFFFKVSVHPSELAPVIQTTSLPLVLLAHPGFPAKTVGEVIAQIKARPGAVSCGSSGSLLTVGCELLRWHARTDMLMVNYKGSALVMNALMAGEINLMIDVVSTAGPQVKAGRVRAIASLNPRRGGAFPDLPTVSETLSGFELVAWQGVSVPAGTPRNIILRLNREIGAVLDDPEVRPRIANTGVDVAPGSVEAFDQLIKSDFVKYEKVLKDAGVKPE
jgi:tripartite-type tricarboxylate transporter receptor subunit TctC